MRKSWIALALVVCCAIPAFALEVTVPDAMPAIGSGRKEMILPSMTTT